MYYTTIMSATFESEKNKKALAYTLVICGLLLLLAFLISWQLPKPPKPIVEDLIEINLGNYDEGNGQVQPLIKGEKSSSQQVPEQQQSQEKSTTVSEPVKIF